jgi:hypothetical protein
LARTVDGDGATALDSARTAVAICALFDELGPAEVAADTIDLEEALNSSGEPTRRVQDESGGLLDELRDALGLPGDDLDGAPVDVRGLLTAIDVPYATIDGKAGTLPDLVAESGEPTTAPPEDGDQEHPVAPSAVLGGRRSPFESDRSFLYDEWDYHRQA